MKARKLTIKVRDAQNVADVWDESYLEGAKVNSFPAGHENPEQWGRELIDSWNRTLRPGDRERVFVSCEIVETDVELVIEPDADEDEEVAISRDYEDLDDDALAGSLDDDEDEDV